jgi:hypothetical protein
VPSTTGENACVVYSISGPLPAFCQTCLPLAASHAVTVPVMPIEYSRPLKNTGVDFGPGPCCFVAGFIANVAG